MSQRDDGGPAWPVQVQSWQNGHLVDSRIDGMTLRDYFAAKAMQAFLSTHIAKELWANTAAMALDAYKAADAMLAERAK